MADGIYGSNCIEKHTVYVFDRGGSTRIAQLLDISQLVWTRDRDGVSEATLRIQGSACSAQADTLAGIEPKRHELVVFRGNDRVWEGPVWRVGWHSDWVEVTAHDIFEYIRATPLSRAWDNTYPNITEVTTRISNILEYELTTNRTATDINGNPVTLPAWEHLSPPASIQPYLDIRHYPNEARTSALTKPYEMTVGEHIQNLARTGGVDWTVLGRSFICWDVSRYLGRTRQLTEADFLGSEVILTAYGADHAQSAYVVGQDVTYGQAHNPENLAYYGPWTIMFTAYNEEGTTAPTQDELDSQARRNTNGRSPVPLEVRVPDNSTIRLDDTLTIADLVPGVQVPLLATLNARRTSQMQKIDHVRVTETADGETIQIIMMPATRPDEDDVEP